jgi:hypothetical protein
MHRAGNGRFRLGGKYFGEIRTVASRVWRRRYGTGSRLSPSVRLAHHRHRSQPTTTAATPNAD